MTALSTSAFVTCGVSVWVPPIVWFGFATARNRGLSPDGTTRIALAGTLPALPGVTAWTWTDASDGTVVEGGVKAARGTTSVASVRNWIPPSVETMLPDATVLLEVGS